MIDLQEFLSIGSIVSLLCFLIRGFLRTIRMGGVSTLATPLSPQPSSGNHQKVAKRPRIEGGVEKIRTLNDGVGGKDVGDHRVKSLKMMKRRPSRLVLPDFEMELCNEMVVKENLDMWVDHSSDNVVHEVEGRGFFLASRRGMRKDRMEDRYGVMLDVMGNPKQAFFAVIDGHGGEAAAEFVSQNLGNNIIKELQTDIETESAIRRGYLQTDAQFLNKDVNGGACAASVLLKDGQVHVANAGDCRVVLSRNGVAHLLTSDHCLSREDERLRIQNSGGYVQCWNGVWRVNGSLAVSRAIGDGYLKPWVISEPEMSSLSLASSEISYGDFLILASDGLWDKVGVQEAVDTVRGSTQSGTRMLLDMSCNRGCRDDITVLIVDLHPYFC